MGSKRNGQRDAPDGNVDLELSRRGERKIVQCKRWTARVVGVDEVRELGGTLLREKLPAGAGVLVTLSDFSQQARAEAAKSGINLVNGRAVYSRMEKVRRPEPCPLCAQPMALDRSPYGWWYHCTAPGCRGKRDLSADPGLAVDMLLARPWRA